LVAGVTGAGAWCPVVGLTLSWALGGDSDTSVFDATGALNLAG
jgi:hypothetical protein